MRIRAGLITASLGLFWLAISMMIPSVVSGQTTNLVHGADDRYKVDIMVVVAHPDDEAGFTPYLARAIYDLHKRVAVVFGTHGGSGGNNNGREHGPALADIREIEARKACAKLGITDVWFLDGKDTASQNVLNSLANWGHGANLEKLVGLMRLTRPEIVMTNLPGIFIGENHGDHQAAGVLTTEAFDLAGDPVAFPAQVAGDMHRNEMYLENMQPWHPKKLYYSDDTPESEKYSISGPAYSVKEVSPSQKKPYWHLAIEAAMPHMTQFPAEIERVSKLSDAELDKMMNDPHTEWWSEPMKFILAKSIVPGNASDDVFAHLDETPIPEAQEVHRGCPDDDAHHAATQTLPRIELGGPWLYLREFRNAHELCTIPVAQVPEIGIKSGLNVTVPITVLHDASKTLEVTVTSGGPENWKVKSGTGKIMLPAEGSTNLRVDIDTPVLAGDEVKKEKPQEVVVAVEADGKKIGDVTLKVQLAATGLPQ